MTKTYVIRNIHTDELKIISGETMTEAFASAELVLKDWCIICK